MHGCMMENVQKIKIKLENIWIDLIRSIYAPSNFLGRFVHVYLDNIFIYSQSIQEHIEHIMKVLQWLREWQFYLSRSKLDLFSDKTDCLGHVINDNGIHTELDKMRRIREWRIPWNYNEVQNFLGLVQYLALYMPDIMTYTTPLSGLAQNNQTFQ